jgi:outer membrane protein assembly factor BamB
MRTHLLAACLVVLLTGTATQATDWPFFRGPEHNGISKDTGWVAEWPRSGPKVAWQAEVGIGASSFAVVGDKVITMGNQRDHDVVTCFHIDDGRVLWQFTYPCPFDRRQFDGGTASTPTVDGDFVYTLSYDGQLHCIRLSDGKPVWKKHLIEDLKGSFARWKYACSPLIVGDLLILDVGGAGSSTVALNKKDGSVVWSVGREGAGYATPIPYTEAGRERVLVFKGKAMVSHDLRNGAIQWSVPWSTSYDVNASSPSVVGDKLVVSSGYNDGRTVAFQLTGSQPRQLWRNDDLKTKMSSVVVIDGHVYGVSSDGRMGGHLMCLSLADGSVKWSQAGFGQGTLTAADGKLIVLSERGEMVIAEATPSAFKEISRAQVLGQRCWVQPVIAHGRILAKNNRGQMVCLDVRK